MGAAQPQMTDEQILRDMQSHYANLGEQAKSTPNNPGTTTNTEGKPTQPYPKQNEESIMNKQEPKQIPALYQEQPKPIEHIPIQVQSEVKQSIPINVTKTEPKPKPNIETHTEPKHEVITQSIPQPEPQPIIEPKKPINLEHVTIEKIFQINITDPELNPSVSKTVYLELYHAQLLSENKPIEFSLENLDDIILAIINDSPYSSDIIPYFLKSYSRAYQIIDVRYKNQLNEKFKAIPSTIATILAQLISSSSDTNLSTILSEYYSDPELDQDELLSLLSTIVTNSIADEDTLIKVFSYIFNIMHLENIAAKPQYQSFFNCDKIRRNVTVLGELFKRNPILRKLYVKEVSYCPMNLNGAMFQGNCYFGPMMSMSPLLADANALRNHLKTQLNDNTPQIKAYSTKLMTMHLNFNEVFQLLLEDPSSSQALLDYFIHVITINNDITKLHNNFMTIASDGFLWNCSIACLNLFFNESKKIFPNETKGVGNNFLISQLIDIDYCLTKSRFPFDKFDFINAKEAKTYINSLSTDVNAKEYNAITKLFFISHCIISYFIKRFEESYERILQSLQEMANAMAYNTPNFKDYFAMMTANDIYIKNPDLIHMILDFNQITHLLIFSLNNSKYTHSTLTIDPQVDPSQFYNDFLDYITITDIGQLSMLPQFTITSTVLTSTLLMKYSKELYFKDQQMVKSYIYFSIVYSSNIDLILHPYLRSEIFDLLTYTFLVNDKEKNAGYIQGINSKILKDPFVENNLIKTLIRVFIDAERLGTSNQFYEKLSIRNKVFSLIENIFKRHDQIFKDRIVFYAEHNDDINQMLLLLMHDVTYLVDEVILRLPEIKAYQDLLNDKEAYAVLDNETKELEEKKFKENDRLLPGEVALLNSSLGFMVIISSCLQKYFIEKRLAEELANLLNYVLDEFTTKTSKMKIKDKSKYNFNPSSIFGSLIKIYVAFRAYEEFHDYVVSDTRSYHYDNFLTAVHIQNTKKSIVMDYETKEAFEEMVNVDWKEAEERVKMNTISYEDAPEEFIDPITNEIMEDPVILPSSKIITDRISIEKYLLSNPTDPFNRSPLTIDMVVGDGELKERIRKYKEEKKEMKRKEVNEKRKTGVKKGVIEP